MPSYEKKGYLKEEFRCFHIRTQNHLAFPYHYHDFHKILFFLKGNITYHVEGRSFDLLPQDIVLIPSGELHRPVSRTSAEYERMILYLSPAYLTSIRSREADLSLCFQQAKRQSSNVIRIPASCRSRIFSLLSQLELEASPCPDSPPPFAGDFYQRLLVQELLILLNRASMNSQTVYLQDTCENEKILPILDFISSHLTEPLSVDRIAGEFYISRYHLMHLFKASTGYTLGDYITIKRLLYARSLIQSGRPITEACYFSGFQTYSAFSRAYKKHFHTTPRKDF